jgi:hypothetical protein
MVAVAGVALYLIYELVKGAKVLGSAATAAGQAVATGYNAAVTTTSNVLYALFGPSDRTANTYYRVGFPDGSAHAIADTWLAPDSTFVFLGGQYQLLKGSDGSLTAKLLSDPNVTIVTMPDGSHVGIPTGTINFDQTVSYNGTTFQITADPATNSYFATVVPGLSGYASGGNMRGA